MLEQILIQLANKLSKQRGFKTPYELIVRPELPLDSKGRERIVIITAGTPPKIIISRLYIEACVAAGVKSGMLPGLRDTMERTLEYLPNMYHTLSLLPSKEAVGLRKDSRKWAKSLVPQIRTQLAEQWFEYTYSVTVRDKLSQTSITRHGKDIAEITRIAKQDLSHMVIEDEEMEEYREKLEYERKIKDMQVKANEIHISIGEGSTETRTEY